MSSKNMNIYYSCNSYPSYSSNVWCTRWDESGYSVTTEFIIESGARNTIYENIVPGATRELYNILGKPKYIDTTYDSGNTLRICPISGYGLSSLREERIIAVKSYSDSFLTSRWFTAKIEGYRLDI